MERCEAQYSTYNKEFYVTPSPEFLDTWPNYMLFSDNETQYINVQLKLNAIDVKWVEYLQVECKAC